MVKTNNSLFKTCRPLQDLTEPNLTIRSNTHLIISLTQPRRTETHTHTHSTQPRTRARQETNNEKYVNPKPVPETKTQQEGTTSAGKQSCRPTLG